VVVPCLAKVELQNPEVDRREVKARVEIQVEDQVVSLEEAPEPINEMP